MEIVEREKDRLLASAAINATRKGAAFETNAVAELKDAAKNMVTILIIIYFSSLPVNDETTGGVRSYQILRKYY